MMRRSRRIEVRRLRLGRGTGNEVQLPDIRVDLAAAALYPRDGILTVQALGPSLLNVNGRRTRSSALEVGDEIQIGPYRLQLTDPPADCDVALVVELVQPLGDSLLRLSSQVGRRSQGAAIGKRIASWTCFLIVALVFIGGPVIAYFSNPQTTDPRISGKATPIANLVRLWEPGEISNAHRFFVADCTTCHRAAFRRVPDEACLGCHDEIGRHTEKAGEAENLRHAVPAMRCTQCHEEHRGNHALIVKESGLCLQCHQSLTKRLPDTRYRDVFAFPDHPQFRATLVADAAQQRLQRVELDSKPPPVDRPGIKFSHAAHLVPEGFPVLGYKPMICADCHTAEPGGQGFSPVTYERNCRRCHELDFERLDLPWPSGRVPHGDDIGIAASVWNFYAGKVLQGGISDAPTPPVNRRVPGAPEPPARETLRGSAWVNEKAEAALRRIIFDEKRGCAYCHFGTGADGAFDLSGLQSVSGAAVDEPSHIVAPVLLRSRFLPWARFDHAKHAAADCEHCHAARQAAASGTVLIPGIANCSACHGAEQATARAQSSCITCHRFHNSGFGPMRAAGMVTQ